MPLFWSGHAQIGAALAVLLVSQLLGWFVEPASIVLGRLWTGNLLSENYLLAAALWLAGAYAYLYSDIVVRKVGVYLGLAGLALVMAEVSLLWGFETPAEWIIAAMAATAAAANMAHAQWNGSVKNLERIVPPLGWVLSFIAVFWAAVLHVRTTSPVVAHYEGGYETGGPFVAAMILTAVALRASAFLCRRWDARSAGAYVFLSAIALLIAAAGGLRSLGLEGIDQQAPWMMLVPIGYLVASRLERGSNESRALHWVSQLSLAVVLGHVAVGLLDGALELMPLEDRRETLILCIVLAEAGAL
jgi:hypothetical protein